jgi:hypothetical protein
MTDSAVALSMITLPAWPMAWQQVRRKRFLRIAALRVDTCCVDASMGKG